METTKLILKILKDAGKPLRPGDIASSAGIDKKEADKAIKELKKTDKIYSPKRCFYDVKN